MLFLGDLIDALVYPSRPQSAGQALEQALDDAYDLRLISASCDVVIIGLSFFGLSAIPMERYDTRRRRERAERERREAWNDCDPLSEDWRGWRL